VGPEVNAKKCAIGSIFFWLSSQEEAFIGSTNTEPEMIARTHPRKTSSNRDALAAFVQRKAEIDAMLTRLQALSDDHFGVAPDEVTWGHVGSLGHHAELLKRITAMAFGEGEHAV
jgi:hypothetical protein